MNISRLSVFLLAVLALLPAAATAAQFDAPVMASEVQGQAKVVAIVVAGNSGAPAGFTIQWMKYLDYLANGSQWYAAPNAVQAEASFTGVPTVNTWDGLLTSFSIAPTGVAAVEIGDLFDETGVAATSTDELAVDTKYIFRAYANGDGATERSNWSNNYLIDTTTSLNCTYTQGYWKNHPEAWTGAMITLGSRVYAQSELLDILHEPAHGNGLVILAHQLIAAELNVLQGADPTAIASALASAHALIGSLVVPPVGGDSLPSNAASSLAQQLDDYNNGITGPGHCGPVAVPPSTWAGTKAAYR